MNNTNLPFKKLKVMTIFGTRPEIIRLSRIFYKLDEHVEHVMVHTRQSFDYELDRVFFEDLKIRKPDHMLEVRSSTLGGQIANIFKQIEPVLVKERPDAVLILGDTNSALSSVLTKRMKIPIFHMEAGNRCFDDNVPEEINRRIIDHISDINLPYSENARTYLIKEGVHPGKIFVTGSPLFEVLNYYKKNIEKSSILEKLSLEKKKFFVASIHREENIDKKESLEELIYVFNLVADIYRLPIILSVHPRTRQRLKDIDQDNNKLINFHKPLGFFDYIKLQKNSFCVLSDSGTILEECSVLGFPAVQLRTSSERPEAYDKGAAILTGLNKDMILQSIKTVTNQSLSGEKFTIPNCYLNKNVSSVVLRLILGLAKNINNK